MQVYVALLRAVNVGGTGKLPMAELKEMCERAGFSSVRTYIQSGNVVFRSALSKAKVQAALEERLAQYAGKPVGVLLRTASELHKIRAGNPFTEAAPNRVIVMFYGKALPKAAVSTLEGPDGEVLVPSGNELFIHYPNGLGRSKLKVPQSAVGTGRNLNTITKLCAMAEEGNAT